MYEYLLPRKTQFVAQFKPPGEVQVRRWDFAWRILVFLALESAFLALATFCLERPIPLLPSSFNRLTEAKAVTAAFAVIWHTVALFPIKDIISTVFSAECIAQYRRTGLLQPNVTDRVSCITSGLLVQASHFLALRPTLEYRLTFLLVLSTMILIPLGPSVIGLSPTWVTHYEVLQIANLTMTHGFQSASQHQCFAKADEIVNLELVEAGTYGYNAQTDGVLIPWLVPGFETSQKIIKYDTDVVLFDCSCQWPEFAFNKTHVVITGLPHISWSPWDDVLTRMRMERLEDDIILPLSNPQDDPLPLSAFIFVYKHPKVHDDFSTVTTWINITKEDMMRDADTTITFEPGRTAAVLLCDSRFTTRRAEVTLQDGKLNATLAEASLLGNFPESAANSLFSQVFLKAFAPRWTDFTGPAVATTFTVSHGDNSTILSLPKINQNMNKAIQSAAKAYISGYTGIDGSRLGLFPSYTSFNQTVAVRDQQISLVSSQPFVVGLWVLYGLMILLLAMLWWATSLEEMQLFNLQTMEAIYRDLPTSDGDLSSPQKHHPDASKLGITWRVLIFATLEVGFLVFAGYCLTNPIPVHLPSFISPPQAISATTAVVVTWRALAIIPIKDIISSVLSAECIAQYQREGYLEPNRTDQVSRATSGLVDQILYFWSLQPTLEYRLAFLLALLAIFIGPLGPGVISLTESLMASQSSLRVANMSVYHPHLDLGLLVADRTKSLIELELLEGRVYGYNTVEDGLLIPWPESGLEQSQNVTMYGSDVVAYNYSCHWTTVELNYFHANPGIIIPGGAHKDLEWSIRDTMKFDDSHPLALPGDEAILSLTRLRLNNEPGPVESPFTAVIFSGNSTLMDLGSTGTFFHVAKKGPSEAAMLHNVLLCDPQYTIWRANVTLSSGQLSANILPDLPLIGNFPEVAATNLFFQALIGVLGPQEEDPDRLLNPISMLLFTGEFNGTDPLRPLPLPVINNNMNRVLRSAAKAYLSGYYLSDDSALPRYSLWNQTVTVQYQQLALVASRPFFIGLLALVAVTVVILVVLLKAIDFKKVQLFNLQTLEKIYTEEMCSREDRKDLLLNHVN